MVWCLVTEMDVTVKTAICDLLQYAVTSNHYHISACLLLRQDTRFGNQCMSRWCATYHMQIDECFCQNDGSYILYKGMLNI